MVASEVVLEIRWDPGCGAQMQLAQWRGSMERRWQQPRTGARSGQKQPQPAELREDWECGDELPASSPRANNQT